MPRTFVLALFLALSGASLPRAAAQGLVRPEPGQAVVPQSLLPAQPPALPQAPGFLPQASSSAAPTTKPQGHPKTPSAAQQAHQVVAGTTETPKQPEQTKLTRVYRGTGSFDEAMAEKLRPMLAKTFAPLKNNDRSPSSRTVQSASSDSSSGPSKDENPRKIAEVGKL